jgi:hypothetical protein
MITETFSARKKLFFWTLLIFLSLIFSLLISEFGLRLIYREEEANGNYWGIGAFSGHDLTGYVHAPGYEGYAFRPDAFESLVKINSLSLRQEDLEQQLQYPVKLLILGDSFSFGLGVQEEQSFPSLIKKYLNALNVGIINGAQTGYSVEQEKLFGVSLINRLKPNIVILGLYTQNDIFGDYYKGYHNIDVKFGYRLQKDRWLQIRPFDFLRTHSYLWMVIKKRLNLPKERDRRTKFKVLTKASLQEVIRPTLNAIVKLRDYCETNNIVFGVVMIPPKSGRTVFDKHLKVFFQAEEIAVLNLGTKSYGNQDYLSGDAHWNKKGHEKASQFLVPFVVKLLE